MPSSLSIAHNGCAPAGIVASLDQSPTKAVIDAPPQRVGTLPDALHEFYMAVGNTANAPYAEHVARHFSGREVMLNRILQRQYGVDLTNVGTRPVRSLQGPLVVYDFDETITRATFVETAWGVPEEERYRGLAEWGGFDADRLEALRGHLQRVGEKATLVILSFNRSWHDPAMNFDLRSLLAFFGLLDLFAAVYGLSDLEAHGMHGASKASFINAILEDPEGLLQRHHTGLTRSAVLVDDDDRHCEQALEAGLHAHRVEKYVLWPGHDPVGGIGQSDFYAVEAWVSVQHSRSLVDEVKLSAERLAVAPPSSDEEGLAADVETMMQGVVRPTTEDIALLA